MAFVYKIVHIATGRCYVGHTTQRSAEVRFYGHVYDLKRNQHCNILLQRGWNKYGASAFELVTIEECSGADKLVREQHYIDTEDSFYNIAKVVGSRAGVPQPEEMKARLRARVAAMTPGEKSYIARKPSDFRDTMQRVMAGKSPRGSGWSHEEEVKVKIRASNKANTTRAHVGMKDKNHRDSSKRKMSVSHTGKVASPETCAKMSATRRHLGVLKKLDKYAKELIRLGAPFCASPTTPA